MADLITLEEYKLAKQLTKLDDDVRLASLISAVSQLVKTYCATSFVDYVSTDKVETFSFDYVTKTIQVNEAPIISITKVEERSSYGEDYVELTEAAFEFYTDKAVDCVYRTSTSGYSYWPMGPGGVRVTYKGGYATIPEDIKLAVIDLVTYYKDNEYKERRTIGTASIANNPTSTQWRNVGFPDHIKRILDLYKHIQV